MSLNGYPIDREYINQEEGESTVRPVQEERTPEEIDKTHTHLRGDKSMSIDDKIDAEAVIENDGRSKNNTFFYADEAPPEQRERYKRLAKWNDGMREDDRHQRTRATDHQRTAQTFCSSLDMTKRQQERVVWLVKRIDMNMFGHYGYEQIIVALISLVANEDGRWIRDEEQFREVAAANGMGLQEVRRVRQMTKEDRRWESGTCPF